MRESFSIWWFAGILMLAYGVVIFATGLWELSHPLLHPPVLSNLHAPIWWGALLPFSVWVTPSASAPVNRLTSEGNSKMAKQMTFGVIVGNRGFFPDHLAKTGREEMLRVLEAAGIRTIALSPEASKFGAVETPTEAGYAVICSASIATKSME